MRKKIISVLVLITLFPMVAFAGGQYIIPDSNIRYLTYSELWEWNFESLGYILNEIFARHGYNFEVGKKYYNYFNDRPWYTPNEDPNNQRACYSQLSGLEWDNEQLVKVVREEMRKQGTQNPSGKNYRDYIEDNFDVLSGFYSIEMKPNQKFPVYSAPDLNSYRGAKGKATVSTNGAVYAAGWDGGWLLIMYLTNNGSVRVGYIEGNKMKDHLNSVPMLNFDYTPVTLLESASLTDDPAMSFTTITKLPSGSQVYYLSEYQNRYSWAYVETILDGQAVRGFMKAEALGISCELGTQEDLIGEDK